MKGREAASDELLPAASCYASDGGCSPVSPDPGQPCCLPWAWGTVPECQALDMNLLSSGISPKPIFQERKLRHREAESE